MLTAAGVVSLPLTHADAGTSPPCGTCPKIAAGRPKTWDQAAEFTPGFWDFLAWCDEAAALNEPLAGLTPLTRAAAAEVARWRADRRDRRRARYAAEELAVLLGRK